MLRTAVLLPPDRIQQLPADEANDFPAISLCETYIDDRNRLHRKRIKFENRTTN